MVAGLTLGFIFAAVLSLALTPWVIRIAFKVGAVDQPDERKVHVRPMPRLGGVAIFLSCIAAIAGTALLDPAMASSLWLVHREGIILGVALILVLALGIWDDLSALRPGRKFAVQLIVSTLVYAAGFRIASVTNPFGPGLLELKLFDYLATVLWVVGITNAVNLIDGLDGLASGVAAIACLTIAPIAMMNADTGTALAAVVLSGALVGFLRYNFNPARIFLGDSGSLLIGFSLAILSMRSSTKGSTAFAIIVPVLALGLPIMDTLLSMIRRLLRSFLHQPSGDRQTGNVFTRMFLPDRGHIHHRLIARGFSHRNAVLVLYVVSCALGAGAFAVTVMHGVEASLILVVVGIAVVIGIRQLKYNEMAILRNGILLPVYELDIVNRDTFRAFLDVAFILLAYFLANCVTDTRLLMQSVSRGFITEMVLVSVIQISIFWLSGLYKGTLRRIGVGDALRVTKAVALAVIATGVIFAVFVRKAPAAGATTLVLDFYILLTLVLGTRMSFRVLTHLSRPAPKDGRRVLLYGAGEHGELILQKMLSGDIPDFAPLGFLDDDPHLEGKTVDGYPVYGGHWKLRKLVHALGVETIFLISGSIRPEVQRRVLQIARAQGLELRRLNLAFEDINVVPASVPRGGIRSAPGGESAPPK